MGVRDSEKRTELILKLFLSMSSFGQSNHFLSLLHTENKFSYEFLAANPHFITLFTNSEEIRSLC